MSAASQANDQPPPGHGVPPAWGPAPRPTDRFILATVSLIATVWWIFGVFACGKDWFRVATVSLIAFRVCLLYTSPSPRDS